MPVTDNRTLASNADTTTGWTGGWAVDTETVIEGIASLATSQTSLTTPETNLYNFGAAQNFSNTVWYMWFNCAVAAFLQLEANGGITMRFTGPTTTNWIEFDVAGSDTYTGGWKQAVVDIEKTPSRTGGTPPLTSAIQYVGIVVAGLTVRPRMQDNCWVDAMWYINKDKAATTIYGNNTGWDQVVATASAASWGTVKRGPGGSVVLNGGIQFGTSSNENTIFEDVNQVILWEDNEVPDDYYKIVITGSDAGSTDFVAGTKVGTGDTAVGISGWVIAAAAVGDRFDLDLSSRNVDSGSFYSSNFQHGRIFNLENNVSEFISCQFSDVSAITQSSDLNISAITGSQFLTNTFLDFDVTSNEALIYTYSPENIKYNSFVGGVGHAINVTQTGSFVFSGNTNSGFGANDTGTAFLLNSSGGPVTMSIADNGDGITYRNTAGSSTLIVNTITLTLTGIVNDSEVRIFTGSTYPQTELAGQESVTTGQFQYNYEYSAGTKVDIIVFKEGYKFNEPQGRIDNYELLSTNTTIPIVQQIDRNYIT